jgi:hypothetical protein
MGNELLLSSGEIRELCAAMAFGPPFLLSRSVGGVVRSDGGEVREVPSEIRGSLRVLAEPDVAVTVHARVAGAAKYVFIATRGPEAALHQPLPGDLHRIGVVDPSEVPSLALETAGLGDRASAGAVRFTVAAADLRVASERARLGRLDDAAMALRGAGVTDGEAAARFASGLGRVEAVASVTALRWRTPARADGVTVGWLDCGADGLWRIEGPNLATGSDAGGLTPGAWYHTPATVSAVSADELRALVTAGIAAPCEDETGLGRSSEAR